MIIVATLTILSLNNYIPVLIKTVNKSKGSLIKCTSYRGAIRIFMLEKHNYPSIHINNYTSKTRISIKFRQFKTLYSCELRRIFSYQQRASVTAPWFLWSSQSHCPTHIHHESWNYIELIILEKFCKILNT